MTGHVSAHVVTPVAAGGTTAPAESPGLLAHRHEHVPAWLRKTDGEPRWQMSLSLAIAVGLQFIVPERLAFHPRWLMPSVEGAFLIAITVANPGRINRVSQTLRTSTFFVGLVVSFANAWSLALLVKGLVRGTEGESAGPLLLIGAAIWGTNVIVFSLWYWEFDRGGPVARAHANRFHPDLLFPQMVTPEYVRRTTGSRSTSTTCTRRSPMPRRSAPPTRCRSAAG